VDRTAIGKIYGGPSLNTPLDQAVRGVERHREVADLQQRHVSLSVRQLPDSQTLVMS
jgi:hypothetical protein